jgi:hypothetical protein
MNYETAKQLEEAGYPQGGDGKWVAPLDKLVVRSSDRVYAPTLDELMEMCGKGFQALTLEEDGGWSCFGRNNDGLFEGSSPTEAVARLWLALNHGN